MKLKIITFPIMALICILVLVLSSCSIGGLKETATATTEAIQEPAESRETAQASPETETVADDPVKDLIIVIKPQPGQLIESPLVIEGEARGTWFFEASFPVKLADADGNIIALHYAQAQGEWMTEEFVPFKAELIFEKPYSDTGTLILEKDNPSGLAEHDAKIEIPVNFKKESGEIIEDMDPQKGEYFAGAILKSIDSSNNTIIVEQLINEPNEKEISPEVILSGDCKIVKIILERPEEKEIVSEITLDSIKLGSEIGIIFKADNTARAIIYQEIIEK